MSLYDIIDSPDSVQALLELPESAKTSCVLSLVWRASYTKNPVYTNLLKDIRKHILTPPTRQEYIHAFNQSSIVTSVTEVSFPTSTSKITVDTIFGIKRIEYLIEMTNWLADMETVHKTTIETEFKERNHMTRQKAEELEKMLSVKCVSFRDFL